MTMGRAPVWRQKVPELFQGVEAGKGLQLRLHHLQAHPGRDGQIAAHKLKMCQRVQAAQIEACGIPAKVTEASSLLLHGSCKAM